MALFSYLRGLNWLSKRDYWFKMSLSGLLFLGQAVVSDADTPATMDDALYNLRVRNYSTALTQLTPLAEAGDAQAQYRLATLYLKGHGVDRSILIAANWLKKSAAQANANACYQLGKLLEAGRDIEVDLKGAVTAYQCAQAGGKRAAADDIERVNQQLKNAPSTDNLIALIDGGQLSALQRLLDDRTWLDRPLSNGYTPLCQAIVSNQAGVVSLLITEGANRELPAPNGQPPLVFAITQGRPEMVETLLALNAPVDSRDQRGNSALHHAVRLDDFTNSEKLLAAGADANAVNDGNKRPLDFSHDTAPQIIALLARYNAKQQPSTDTNPERAKSATRLDYDNLLSDVASDQSAYAAWPALNVAAFRGQTDVVEAMITHGANIESTDSGGQTPLMRAASQGHSDVVAVLLSAGANPLASSETGLNALALAVAANEAHTVKQILAHIDSPLVRVNIDDLLNNCSRDCNEDTLLALLQNIPTSAPKLKQATLDTALISASRQNYFAVAALLVDAGADVNTTSDSGVTPIWWAAYHNDALFAAQLIAAGSLQNDADTQGKTPLHIAAERADDVFLTTLNPSAATLDLRAALGNTPLILAVAAGNERTINWLLARKVNIAHRNQKSLTALMIACQNDRADLAKLLLDAGAKINRRNKEGKNCLEQARDAGAAHIIALLGNLK